MNLYQRLRLEADRMEDKKSCGVISLASACDISYTEAHYALRRSGRQHRSSTSIEAIKRACHLFNKQMIDISMEFMMEFGGSYTVGEIIDSLNPAPYIVYIDGHLFTIKNNEVVDFNDNIDTEIVSIYAVEDFDIWNL